MVVKKSGMMSLILILFISYHMILTYLSQYCGRKPLWQDNVARWNINLTQQILIILLDLWSHFSTCGKSCGQVDRITNLIANMEC